MNMYKVVLVDDEELIIEGMKQLVDWESLGCRGVHFNAWKLIVWMAYVRGIKSREPGFYLLYVKKSFSGQNRIIAFHGMPFAQDKTIPVPRMRAVRAVPCTLPTCWDWIWVCSISAVTTQESSMAVIQSWPMSSWEPAWRTRMC